MNGGICSITVRLTMSDLPWGRNSRVILRKVRDFNLLSQNREHERSRSVWETWDATAKSGYFEFEKLRGSFIDRRSPGRWYREASIKESGDIVRENDTLSCGIMCTRTKARRSPTARSCCIFKRITSSTCFRFRANEHWHVDDARFVLQRRESYRVYRTSGVACLAVALSRRSKERSKRGWWFFCRLEKPERFSETQIRKPWRDD